MRIIIILITTGIVATSCDLNKLYEYRYHSDHRRIVATCCDPNKLYAYHYHSNHRRNCSHLL
ncbi:hypothetical protein [Chitinophaga sp. LS1]|uniref:hypothetical protein n=1 Tax=Chitinophaga sp. LS1 TaxID=3051176 RepID=UPI002AABE955|nr:hypothetical protein [Chitinophaga sp. LS1]WPV66111.1 hypothetical protein QQL36_30390 [Chitinophaga sp. LS1]